MTNTLTVAYKLHPSADTPVPTGNLPASKTHEFPVGGAGTDSNSTRVYYESLRAGILQAKDVLGQELTAWRDAVGSKESSKEPKKVKTTDEDEEEEEEEEE